MRAAGLAKIQAAKRDGSWSLLESVESGAIPADLRKLLAAAKYGPTFDALSNSARRAHLYSLATAKRPETRARRLAAIVRALRG